MPNGTEHTEILKEMENVPAKCSMCNATYNLRKLVGMVILSDWPDPGTKEYNHYISIKCANCKKLYFIPVNNKFYWIFEEALNNLRNRYHEELAGGEPLENPSKYFISTNQQLPSPPLPSNSVEPPKNKVAKFQTLIKEIDKNLSAIERTPLIRDALCTMIDVPSSDLETCFKIAKEEFKLTARDIEAFRKDLNSFKGQMENKQQRKEHNDVMQRYSAPPKELTELEKQEALTYLQDPYLIINISRDITEAGEVVGEENNKMMLYLAAISRKLKEPISLVIFGKSSSGKSYLANAVEKFIPPEDKLVLSSVSPRAFEYLGGWLKNKFVLVQEWEGIESLLPTLRTLQSEGKLTHLVSTKGPDDKTHSAVALPQECPCSVVITTTKERIHDENSTRIFELYADESVAQTVKVVEQNILKGSIKNRKVEQDILRIFELHHNVQRLLEPIEVNIPYAELLSFPARTTRNRRDSARFIQLIKTVAFLRQKQKDIMFYNNTQYIEADIYDYEIAYIYGIPIISATLDQISSRAKNALRVCCALMDEFSKGEKEPFFTVNQIIERSPALGFDFDNRQDLYKQLDSLTEHEYLELNQPKFKGTKYYTVIFNYVRDHTGNIINIDTPEIKEITTPSILKEKLSMA